MDTSVFTATSPYAVGAHPGVDALEKTHANTVWLKNTIKSPSSLRGCVAYVWASDPARAVLQTCEQMVMNDGSLVGPLSNLQAAFGTIGAGGLDTGTEQASTWYKAFVIRKSTDGTTAAMLVRGRDRFLDQSSTTVSVAKLLRADAARTMFGQGFKVSTTGPCEQIDIVNMRSGNPSGDMWMEIQSDNAGSPSGTILATGQRVTVNSMDTANPEWLRFTFPAPPSLTAGTQYHWVVKGTWTEDGSNFLQVYSPNTDTYANGTGKQSSDGVTWSGLGVDFCFKVYITRNDNAPVLPSGYDQYAQFAWFYNDASSNLVPMVSRDRRMFESHRNTSRNSGDFASKLNALIDWSALVPAVPVTAYLGLGASDICGVGVTGMMDIMPSGGLFPLYPIATASGASTGSYVVPIAEPVTYQSMLISTGGRTARVWALGFEF